jgi:hypothetical protein
MLRWLETVVVSDEEKARLTRQVGIRKASESEPSDDVSKQSVDIETGATFQLRDEPGGCPLIGQVVSGMEAARAWSAASARNVGRRVPTLSTCTGVGAWRREGARWAAETVRC